MSDPLTLGLSGPTAPRPEVERVPEADGKGPAAWNVEASPHESLEGAADSRGNHGHTRPQRHHRDARPPPDESTLPAEGPLREDAHDTAILEHAQRTLHRTRIGALEIDGDRADATVEGRMNRARAKDAGHHEEADGPRHRDAQDYAVQVVVVVGRQDERPFGRHVLKT